MPHLSIECYIIESFQSFSKFYHDSNKTYLENWQKNSSTSLKVLTFWEVYKNLKKNLPVLTLLINFTKNWDIFSNFVAFSQYLNFTKEYLKENRAIEAALKMIFYIFHNCSKYLSLEVKRWSSSLKKHSRQDK